MRQYPHKSTNALITIDKTGVNVVPSGLRAPPPNSVNNSRQHIATDNSIFICNDRCITDEQCLVRTHEIPRTSLFTLSQVVGSPTLSHLIGSRVIHGKFNGGKALVIQDDWRSKSNSHSHMERFWARRTVFIPRFGSRNAILNRPNSCGNVMGVTRCKCYDGGSHRVDIENEVCHFLIISESASSNPSVDSVVSVLSGQSGEVRAIFGFEGVPFIIGNNGREVANGYLVEGVSLVKCLISGTRESNQWCISVLSGVPVGFHEAIVSAHVLPQVVCPGVIPSGLQSRGVLMTHLVQCSFINYT